MNFKRVAALLLAGAMVMTAVPVYAKGDDVTLSVSIWDTNQEPESKKFLQTSQRRQESRQRFPLLNGMSTGQCSRPVHRVVPFRTYSGCTQRESEIHVQRYAS